MVYVLGVGGDDVAANLAYDLQHAVVRVLGVGIVEGSIVKFVGVGIIALFEGDNLLHQRMGQVMPEVGIVCIEISHWMSC